MRFRNIRSGYCCTCLAAVFALLVWAVPACAAQPIFPVGSRIGLVPPPGMVPSPTFEGFEDTATNSMILLSTLPANAFDYLSQSMVPEALKKQGIDKREPITVGTGTGFLLTGSQPTAQAPFRKWMLVAPAGNVTALVTVRASEQDKTYTDKTVRDILETLAVRASVPDSERLMLLPFKVGDLAGFHIDDVLPGRALMLVDEPPAPRPSDAANDENKDTAGHSVDARFLIASLQGGPTDPKNDDEFARLTFERIGGINNVRVQDAEPLRIGGQSGYETLAKAKDAHGATDLMVVQWLKFGTGGYMQMIGIGRADVWPDLFKRLRTVRDSIGAK